MPASGMNACVKIHVTAVAGTGMGALAGLLADLGHEVSGSDTAFYPPMGPALRDWGIRLFEGFSRQHVERLLPLDALVVGNVCRRDNPEALCADELGIEKLHIASALERFALKGTSPLVVAGTHGKTTTSALCAHLLDRTGLSPGYLIGGIPQGQERSFRAAGQRRLASGDGRPRLRRTPFVLEGDEYDTAYWEKTAKFLHYGAEVAVITSIEHDHIDIYPRYEAYLEAFEQLVRSVPPHGLLVAYAGSAAVRHVAKLAICDVAFYAVEGDDVADAQVHWLAAPALITSQGVSFDLFAGGVLAGRYLTPTSGRHNVANATAALAACAQGFGADLRALGPALATFGGVRKRQEVLGTPRGITVIDDFAHHPSAVRETLSGLREQKRTGRLLAVFEPRSATACRRLHQDAYVRAFDAADQIVLAPVGRPELPIAEKLDVEVLAEELRQRGKGALALPNVEAIVAHLVEAAQPGDMVVVLSNGAFGGIHERLLTALAEKP